MKEKSCFIKNIKIFGKGLNERRCITLNKKVGTLKEWKQFNEEQSNK